ncbi:MAG: SRPBCC domain-containing protein [Streptosporangiaceae bacterium]
MSEVTEQINGVERQVGTRVLAAGQAQVLTISQRYRTDIGDLWAACTNPERIGRWFPPVSGDLVPGGRFQIEGNASGTVQRCDPPNCFAATWGSSAGR